MGKDLEQQVDLIVDKWALDEARNMENTRQCKKQTQRTPKTRVCHHSSLIQTTGVIASPGPMLWRAAAIFLLGFGLVAVPRALWNLADLHGELSRLCHVTGRQVVCGGGGGGVLHVLESTCIDVCVW